MQSIFPRRYVLLLLLFCSCAALAQAAPSGVTLEVGLLTAGPEERVWLETEFRAFEAAHPGVTVEPVLINQPDVRRRTLDAFGELSAHVVGVSAWSGYDLAYLAGNDYIVPLDRFLPDPAFERDAFYPNLLDAATYRGQLWGVPWSSHPLLLACNVPMLEAAGIKEPPATWEAFADAASRLTRDADGDGVPEQYGFTMWDISLIRPFMLSLCLQRGVRLFDGAGLAVDRDAFRAVIDEGVRILAGPHSCVANPDPNLVYAMEIVSRKRLREIGADRNLRLAPLPSFGEPALADTGTRYLAVRRSTPEAERMSWELVKWLTRRDVGLPEAWIGVPCRRDVVGRADFRARASSSCRNLEEVYASNAYLRSCAPDNLKGWGIAFGYFWDAVAAAIYRNQPLDEAFERGNEGAERVIEALSLPAPRPYELYR